MSKYFECPSCKGLLSNLDLENEKGKVEPKCKHCGMKFTEGLKFQGVSFKCGNCNITHDDLICPKCGQNNDTSNNPTSKKSVDSIGTPLKYNDDYKKNLLELIKNSKERIRGGKWHHCGNIFNKLENFIEHFENCQNIPKSIKGLDSIGHGFCKKCGILEFLSTDREGQILEGHDCQPLQKDKKNNCLLCKKPIKENQIWEEHKECLEKPSQKSSLGLKLEQAKRNPAMLAVLGGGIIFIILGIVGTIISIVKLNKIGKNKKIDNSLDNL